MKTKLEKEQDFERLRKASAGVPDFIGDKPGGVGTQSETVCGTCGRPIVELQGAFIPWMNGWYHVGAGPDASEAEAKADAPGSTGRCERAAGGSLPDTGSDAPKKAEAVSQEPVFQAPISPSPERIAEIREDAHNGLFSPKQVRDLLAALDAAEARLAKLAPLGMIVRCEAHYPMGLEAVCQMCVSDSLGDKLEKTEAEIAKLRAYVAGLPCRFPKLDALTQGHGHDGLKDCGTCLPCRTRAREKP